MSIQFIEVLFRQHGDWRGVSTNTTREGNQVRVLLYLLCSVYSVAME